MPAITAVRYRWLQKGGAWTENTMLADVVWTDIDKDLVPVSVPLTVNKVAGPDPSTLSFRIRAAGAVSPPGTGIYSADNISSVANRRRPDGTNGNMYYPITGEANTLKEFEIVRLMDAASNSVGDKAAGTCVFVGIVTGLSLASAANDGDVWDVTVSEIARWHMGRIGIYGCRLFKISDESVPWQVKSLPVYNEEGDADQAVDADGAKQLAFINRNYNSQGGDAISVGAYATYWQLGYILNALRWDFGLPPEPDQGDGGILTHNYLSWPAANTVDQWTFLFSVGGASQVVKDFALGGMSLAEAIDQIVTKAGQYEWGCEWDTSLNLYVLRIYSALTGDGASSVSYTRGDLGSDVGSTPPECESINLLWRWDDSLTRIKPLGCKRRWELSIDTGETYPGLQQGWTSAQETAYEADKDNGGEYPSVFQRYTIAPDIAWSTWFGHTSYLEGSRRPMPKLLSSVVGSTETASLDETKLHILAWRYKDGDWEAAPDGVSVHVDSDGSIVISGHGKDEDHRWGEDGSGTAYDIRVTIAVEDDARVTSASAVESVPPGWPSLEAVMDDGSYKEEAKNTAYLPVDGSDAPVIDDPTTTKVLTGTVFSNVTAMTAVAQRTLTARNRPRLDGTIRITALDWTLAPGRVIASLTGGVYRPAIAINMVISAITYDMTEGQESMTLTIGGDTA